MNVPSYPFHSLSLKLSNKEMNFLFPPLKLPNKRREKYSKIILFIPFYFISFPPPNQSLRIMFKLISIELNQKFKIKVFIYIYIYIYCRGQNKIKKKFIYRYIYIYIFWGTRSGGSFEPPGLLLEPPLTISTYTCGVTTTPKVCNGSHIFLYHMHIAI